MIYQGEIYWLDFAAARGSEPAYRHPCVVVQNDVFNRSAIGTTVACPLTSNLKRANSPGNVLLRSREGGLPKRSVVNVSQPLTVDKSRLDARIGKLSKKRVLEILSGMLLVLEPRDVK